MSTCTIRFYAGLNDFLPSQKRYQPIEFRWSGTITAKAAIENIGIPHPEVELILINGQSCSFDEVLNGGDYVSVFPKFYAFKIQEKSKVQPEKLEKLKFIVDEQLGKLARHLRMLGYDTLFETKISDSAIAKTSAAEKRVVLTRDIDLLKHKAILYGYAVRNTDPLLQLKEINERYGLTSKAEPFTRCLECNGQLLNVPKTSILNLLDAETKKSFQEFFRCPTCKKVYWKGSHYERMQELIDSLM